MQRSSAFSFMLSSVSALLLLQYATSSFYLYSNKVYMKCIVPINEFASEEPYEIIFPLAIGCYGQILFQHFPLFHNMFSIFHCCFVSLKSNLFAMNERQK